MHVFNHTNSVQQSDFYNGTTWNLDHLLDMINDGSYNNAAGGSTSAGLFMTFVIVVLNILMKTMSLLP